MEDIESELIELCKVFLRKISIMYFNGTFTKEEIVILCDNKIEFLKKRGVVF